MPLNLEDRRLKIGGLILAVAGFVPLGWVVDQIEHAWPPTPEQQWTWLFAALIGVNVMAAGLLVMAAGFGTARPSVDARRRRAVLFQLLVANLLLPLIFLGNLLDQPGGGEAEVDGLQLALAGAGYVLLYSVWRLWRRSQRQAAPTAAEAMAADPRPPVLYLRSFADDGTQLLDAELGPIARRWVTLLALPTAEEQSTAALDAVGPVVAIGKPGEPLPELGAARLYVGDDRWQAEVLALLDRAALVVLRIGSSPGLLWEIEQSLARLPRRRLVLSVLGEAPVSDAVAARLAPVIGEPWAEALPAPQVRTRLWQRLLRFRPSDRRIGALVCFPGDRPRVFAVARRRSGDGPWWQGLPRRVLRIYRPLASTWREAIDSLELPQAERASRSRAVAISLALLFGVFGAHWFYLGHNRRGAVYLLLFPVLLASAWLGWADAVRFTWADREEFRRRFVGTR